MASFPAIVIPTYNEKENLPQLVEEIRTLGLQFRIIVVDDNSPDGTGALADQLSRQYPELSVIHRPGKLGLGTAYLAGLQSALAAGLDPILHMDSDLSHRPVELPGFLNRIKKGGCDVVIGSRFLPGGRILNRGWQRDLISQGGNLLARFVVGGGLSDYSSGFRGYRAEVLRNIGLDRIKSRGYAFLEEILDLCLRAGGQVREIPITFANRKAGASKLSFRDISEMVTLFLRILIRKIGFKN